AGIGSVIRAQGWLIEAAVPIGRVILRPVTAPSTTRASLMPVLLSPSTRERLQSFGGLGDSASVPDGRTIRQTRTSADPGKKAANRERFEISEREATPRLLRTLCS